MVLALFYFNMFLMINLYAYESIGLVNSHKYINMNPSLASIVKDII